MSNHIEQSSIRKMQQTPQYILAGVFGALVAIWMPFPMIIVGAAVAIANAYRPEKPKNPVSRMWDSVKTKWYQVQVKLAPTEKAFRNAGDKLVGHCIDTSSDRVFGLSSMYGLWTVGIVAGLFVHFPVSAIAIVATTAISCSITAHILAPIPSIANQNTDSRNSSKQKSSSAFRCNGPSTWFNHHKSNGSTPDYSRSNYSRS